MGRLIYSAIASLDGYIEDTTGRFDWAMPSDEVHSFVNDLERDAGTHLYGRRMYETMLVWETDPGLASHSPITRDYSGIWQAADKIVFSRTLQAVSTSRTRIEREFDPDKIRELKDFTVRDLLIGGPGLAAHAFRSGLIDECHLLLVPVIVGGGKPFFPNNIRLDLELQEVRRFGNGMVFLRYRIKPTRTT